MQGLNKYKIIGITLFAMLLTSGTCTAQLHDAFMPRKENVVRDYCYAQQRVIAGALEMYNMDNAEMMTALTDVDVREPGPLIPKYLRTPIENNFECSYSSLGDLTADGYVQCTMHGAGSTLDHDTQELEDFKKAAQELIASGKTVDGPNEEGTTALHMAVENDMPLIVDYLLSLKADPTLKNKKNENALDLATQQQNLRVARLLKASGMPISNSSDKPMQQPVFHPDFTEVDGKVEIKTGDAWQPLNSAATYTLPLSLRTGSESRVAFSMGKMDCSHLDIDLGKFKDLLGNGISIELRQGSELVIEKPVFDNDFLIVTSLPIHLQNGDVRLSVSFGKTPPPTVQIGENISVQCQPGLFKFVYDTARDSGNLVVRVGSVNARLQHSTGEGIQVDGFYKLSFEKGSLGEPHQADIAKEFE